jgi:hypothetical protein
MPQKKNDKDFEPTDLIKIDEIYGIINHVQTSLEKCSFLADSVDAITIENILRDTDIIYVMVEEATGTRFNLSIVKKKVSDDYFNFDEEMEDELPEDGQCF